MKTRRILNPLAIAAEGAARLPAAQRAAIVRNNTAAMAALRKGAASPADLSRLSHALLMADTLARSAPLARKNRARELAAGIDALAAVTRRKEQIGHYVATGPELQAVRDALAVHQVQIEHAALREMECAQKIIDAMVQTKFGRVA